MSQVSFEEILKAWTLEYDERLPSDRRARQEASLFSLAIFKITVLVRKNLIPAKKKKSFVLCKS
jgi:hypothetical protein